jgi:aminoglycoside 6'-N-acetyltransferase
VGEAIELRGERVRLRSIATDDLPALARVLRDPTEARWWGEYDDERGAAEYGQAQEETVVLLIEVAGAAAGMIQFSEETDPDYRHASIDIALLEGHQGQGVGPEAIRVLARHLFEERGHHRLTIDPAVENRNAIRAYEAVGFKRVGMMRQYERGPDGTWHDGLLMDILRGELRDG